MKRMKVLLGQRRMMVLATLVILVLAAAALAASSASFTATSANPGNMFAAGSLDIDNTGEGAAILRIENMVPGSTDTGTVVISNIGTVAGDFTLTKVETDDADDFASELVLVIEEDGAEIYNGALDGFLDGTDNVLDLGNWAGTNPGPNTSRTYDFTVTWPDTEPADDNSFMGASCEYAFNWLAVSN